MHAVHNSPHTSALVRIKARRRISTRVHSLLLEFIAMPMALQFKFHRSGFVTDRHRVPNSGERNLTNGIRYVNDRSNRVNAGVCKCILIPRKVAQLYYFFFVGKIWGVRVKLKLMFVATDNRSLITISILLFFFSQLYVAYFYI